MLSSVNSFVAVTQLGTVKYQSLQLLYLMNQFSGHHLNVSSFSSSSPNGFFLQFNEKTVEKKKNEKYKPQSRNFNEVEPEIVVKQVFVSPAVGTNHKLIPDYRTCES
ncbi:hypothetical protein L2E82_39036 [Cichorium intybus]|uniref:Uncharacterized protein n=1 Tax=Cichorium intybus TaxID=13427 RepID=A0ACB9AHQ6_CICIN|nr:hypothetical protein L2E82_39036 [Cichorium intybus]